MSDIEEPGYAERDGDEFSEQTGGGLEEGEETPAPDQGADWDEPDADDGDE